MAGEELQTVVKRKGKPRGRPRVKGERTKKVEARLARMRSLVAMGLSDTEIRERIEEGTLTDKQWYTLRSTLLQESKGESNLSFWVRFKERHDLRYREAIRLLGFAHGIDNPHRKVDAQGRFLDPTDAFLVKPNVQQSVQVLRLMKDLEESKVEIGLRLNVFQREPTRVMVGRLPEEMTDAELQLAFEEAVRDAAKSLHCSEGEMLALIQRGQTIDAEFEKESPGGERE